MNCWCCKYYDSVCDFLPEMSIPYNAFGNNPLIIVKTFNFERYRCCDLILIISCKTVNTTLTSGVTGIITCFLFLFSCLNDPC